MTSQIAKHHNIVFFSRTIFPWGVCFIVGIIFDIHCSIVGIDRPSFTSCLFPKNLGIVTFDWEWGIPSKTLTKMQTRITPDTFNAVVAFSYFQKSSIISSFIDKLNLLPISDNFSSKSTIAENEGGRQGSKRGTRTSWFCWSTRR